MAAPLKCLRNMMKFSLPIHGYGAGYPRSPVDSHAYSFDWIWEVVLVKLLLIPARLRCEGHKMCDQLRFSIKP